MHLSPLAIQFDGLTYFITEKHLEIYCEEALFSVTIYIIYFVASGGTCLLCETCRSSTCSVLGKHLSLYSSKPTVSLVSSMINVQQCFSLSSVATRIIFNYTLFARLQIARFVCTVQHSWRCFLFRYQACYYLLNRQRLPISNCRAFQGLEIVQAEDGERQRKTARSK